jgi:hypothetical protein
MVVAFSAMVLVIAGIATEAKALEIQVQRYSTPDYVDHTRWCLVQYIDIGNGKRIKLSACTAWD